jgi:nascent polypeptide-associated complex subunit alpha
LFSLNPRELRRMLKRMGITVEELDAEEVVIKLSDGRRMLIESPSSVALMKAKGQPNMIYVIGGSIKEVREVEEESQPFTEEDVKLVAEQAGVSLDEARKALEETKGDIAEAILRLKGQV